MPPRAAIPRLNDTNGILENYEEETYWRDEVRCGEATGEVCSDVDKCGDMRGVVRANVVWCGVMCGDMW
ncbi:hypothetical protein Pmani_037331 [Petrolisthes manimaculis]|uniref:Uncharacterized protein n=1 Tax=Petrolisthes manimaculis TaxID=1843537 RepID=A0AAE1NGJ5_9EUCA|nr:hypothetical protein Pmani_037331 [Petrolisthes manimaculis]